MVEETVNYNIYEIRHKIKKSIEFSNAEYVSFDMFDTLLVRPCISPVDIFELLAGKVDKEYNIDFYSMRRNAEAGLINANIYDIYNTIQKRYGLSDELKNILLNEEIAIETKLLSVREDVKEFYNLAVEKNKKIIVITDMYLPSDIMLNILKEKGYDKIHKLYVSNEYKATKGEGKLFEIVIRDLQTKNIIHIGDSLIADYNMPVSKGIEAYHYPRVIEILNKNYPLFSKLINASYINNAETRNRNILIGYTLNNYWFNRSEYNSKILNTVEDFSNLFLAPYLFYITHWLQHNEILQNFYNKIYFISRDGFLPNKIYNMLNNGKYIPGEYIYGSRIAYWTGTYSSIYDLIKQQSFIFSKDYTIEDLINAHITDNKVNSYLKENFSQEELNTTVKDNFDVCKKILSKQETVLTNYYNEKKSLATAYYKNIFKDEKNRIAIFDIGYNGTLSMGISNLSSKIIDKIFIYESSKNILRDHKYKTHTFVIKNGIHTHLYGRLSLLFEECFSPLEGKCISFKAENNNITPVTEENPNFSNEMKKVYKELHETTIRYFKNLINLFGDYMEYLNITDINPLFDCIIENFQTNPKEKELFKDVIFQDKSGRHNYIPLSMKF